VYLFSYLVLFRQLLLRVDGLLLAFGLVPCPYLLGTVQTKEFSLVVEHKPHHSCVHLISIPEYITYVCKLLNHHEVFAEDPL